MLLLISMPLGLHFNQDRVYRTTALLLGAGLRSSMFEACLCGHTQAFLPAYNAIGTALQSRQGSVDKYFYFALTGLPDVFLSLFESMSLFVTSL